MLEHIIRQKYKINYQLSLSLVGIDIVAYARGCEFECIEMHLYSYLRVEKGRGFNIFLSKLCLLFLIV